MDDHITERKRAEEELQRAQESFRLVVEGVRDHPIFMLDPDGRVRSWSPGAARIKGYAAAEIVGRHFSVFYTPEDVEAGKPARELRIATETGRYEEEGWRVRKDGSRFWAKVVITAIRDLAGKLLGFAKITRDVTERKRQDDRLRAVVEVAQGALEGHPEAELLRLIARRARALVGSGVSVVSLLDPGEDTLMIAAADGAAMGASGAVGPAMVVLLTSGERAIGSLSVTNEPGGPGSPTATASSTTELSRRCSGWGWASRAWPS